MLTRGRSENLRLIRFLTAAGGMVCHSFSIAQGNMEREWLHVRGGGQLISGLVSVAVFFIAGGFFIKESARLFHIAAAAAVSVVVRFRFCPEP